MRNRYVVTVPANHYAGKRQNRTLVNRVEERERKNNIENAVTINHKQLYLYLRGYASLTVTAILFFFSYYYFFSFFHLISKSFDREECAPPLGMH